MYTGAGKTRCGVMAYEKLGRPSTLVVTSRVPILDQWKKVLPYKNVEFRCINSAYKVADKGYDLVIIDEVHRALSPANRRVFENMHTTALMCLTGTLPDVEEYVELLDKYCPVVYQKTLAEAVKEGLVPQFSIYNLQVGLSREISGKHKVFDLQFKKALLLLTRYRMDNVVYKTRFSNIFDMARVMKDEKSDLECARAAKAYWNAMSMRKLILYDNPEKINTIKNIINYLEVDRKWLIFTKTIKFAERAHQALPGSVLYHSKLSKEERAEALQAVSSNRSKILVAVDGLNEGLDIQGFDSAVCASSVSTTLTNLQQLGRLIRPEEKLPPIIINLFTIDTVEKGWVEKKFKNSNLTPIWIKTTRELPKRPSPLILKIS